nr:TonB-dependent receptor [Halalkalibaculum roseum]
MVYDPDLVEGITVYQRINQESVPTLLGTILSDTSLDFLILSTGTIVIVKKVQEKAVYGSYFGKVVGSQTGRPLPGATVMLADASGGTSTNSSGSFALNKLLTGSYDIIFSYIGYEPVSKTITIRPGEQLREEVVLKPKPVDFAPIVVTEHKPQVVYAADRQSADPTGRWAPAGRMQDAIRSLTLFQGVQYGLPLTDLHLQGGQPGEHRIRLDGVPVYNPHSFGQMFSAFSPYALGSVELHKAGFGAKEGSQTAGLIDLTHDIGGMGDKSFMAQADPLSVNLRGDYRIGKNDSEEGSSFNIMGAARFNYWDLFQEPGLQQTLTEWDDLDPLITNLIIDSETDAALYEPREHTSRVRFHDLHLATRYDIDNYKTLSSSLYVGSNLVSTDLLRQAPVDEPSPRYLYARDEYRWNNVMGQVSYTQLVSSRLDLNTQVSYSSNRLRHRYLIGTSDSPGLPNLGLNSESVFASFLDAGALNLVPNQRNANNIQHLIFRTDGTYSFSPRFSMTAGARMDYVESRVDLSDLFYLATFTDQQSTLYSSFLNGSWRPGEYWEITAGNRLTYSSSIGRVYPEPRASVQVDRPDAKLGYWSLRISGGLYRQFINQYQITNPGPTSLVPSFTVWSHAGTAKVPEAWHLSGSLMLEPDEQTGINFEWFYKWQPTAYIVSYDNLLQGSDIARSGFSAFAESTEKKTYGVGLRINRSMAASRLKVMAGYDYSVARVTMDSQFGREVPVPWNQPHRIQFRTLWRVTPVFSTVLKWESVFSRTWAFRQSYYNYLLYEGAGQFGEYDFQSPENDRLSPFHQLDLSFIYRPEVSFMDLELRADLINVLDRRNTIDWSLQPNESGGYDIKKRTMPGLNPSLSIRMGF